MVVLLMRRTIEVGTMAPGTVNNPKAELYAHSLLMSCQCSWKGKSGSSLSLGAVLGRLGYCVRRTDSAALSVVASRIFFGIGNLFGIAR